MLGDKPVDQLAGDADLGRHLRQAVGGKPLCVGDLGFFQVDIAASVARREAHHERVGEGPGLAAKIADFIDLHANFLLHFAPHTVFERLARFYETGNHAVTAGGEAMVARQEYPLHTIRTGALMPRW